MVSKGFGLRRRGARLWGCFDAAHEKGAGVPELALVAGCLFVNIGPMTKRNPDLRSDDTSRRIAPRGVTMEEVGRLAGVSQVTVSRALSDRTKVSAATLAKIHAAIEATGFVPNAIAGALASQKSMLVSALVPSITNIVYAAALQAFSDVLRPSGYQVLLSETGFDPQDEESMIRAHLSRRPDAVVLTGIHHTDKARQMLRAADIPVVEIWDTTETPIDLCVGFSHIAAGQAAAQFAVERGYTSAVTVSADEERALRRQSAFAARFASLTGSDVARIGCAAQASLGDGRAALGHIVEAGFSKGTVIFCSSDVLAHGILTELAVRGLSAPGDVAVIGFGDQAFAADTAPALTTLRVDRSTLGRVAAKALLARFDGQLTDERVMDIGFEVIPRGSA